MKTDASDGSDEDSGCATDTAAQGRVEVLKQALPSPDDVQRMASIFGLMGDPGRVRILVALLEGGEVCVHDLASVSGQSESSVSQALRLMRAHRVVAARREGRSAFYRLADSHVRLLLDVALTHVGHAPGMAEVSGAHAGSEKNNQD